MMKYLHFSIDIILYRDHKHGIVFQFDCRVKRSLHRKQYIERNLVWRSSCLLVCLCLMFVLCWLLLDSYSVKMGSSIFSLKYLPSSNYFPFAILWNNERICRRSPCDQHLVAYKRTGTTSMCYLQELISFLHSN